VITDTLVDLLLGSIEGVAACCDERDMAIALMRAGRALVGVGIMQLPEQERETWLRKVEPAVRRYIDEVEACGRNNPFAALLPLAQRKAASSAKH
jgi:hypothetical protein